MVYQGNLFQNTIGLQRYPPMDKKIFQSQVSFKLNEDKSNNVFREILKCFRKTAKFEFFAKQIIYLESPDHPL